jgi:hypothetical protein
LRADLTLIGRFCFKKISQINRNWRHNFVHNLSSIFLHCWDKFQAEISIGLSFLSNSPNRIFITTKKTKNDSKAQLHPDPIANYPHSPGAEHPAKASKSEKQTQNCPYTKVFILTITVPLKLYAERFALLAGGRAWTLLESSINKNSRKAARGSRYVG